MVAKDSLGTPNTRAASDEASGQATAGAPIGGVYRMIKDNGTVIYGTTSTTAIGTTCGTYYTAHRR